MVAVYELVPGDYVTTGMQSGIFIGKIDPHPIWPRMVLVIWYLPAEKEYSFDALGWHQEVGYAEPESNREENLRLAILGRTQV